MKRENLMKTMGKLIPAILLLALSGFLLKGDVWTFWTWWLLAAVMGIVAMPLTGMLFRNFDDRGWMFSKVLMTALTGFFDMVPCICKNPPLHRPCVCWSISVLRRGMYSGIIQTAQKRSGMSPAGSPGTGLLGGDPVFRFFSFYGPIWPDSILRPTEQKNLWITALWKP